MTRGLMNSLACIETSCGRAMIPSRRSGASRSATAGSCSMTAGTAARQRVAAEHPGRGWDELAGDVVCAKGRDPVGLAFELAVSCSATGARPLTRNERFTASKRLSEIHPEWSLREVAKRTGTSHQTVLRPRGPTGLSGAGPNGPITPSGDNATAARVAARHPTLEQLQTAQPWP